MRPTESRVCAGCGESFEVERRRPNRFCSKRCANSGENNPAWIGGTSTNIDGYVSISTPEGHVREHVLVAERALGHKLPSMAVVHHFNHIRSDNRNRNLVICQDQAYHQFLHQLQRVKKLGGRPHLDKVCSACGFAKPKSEFSPSTSRGLPTLASCCRPCAALQQLLRRSRLSEGVSA